MRQPRRSLERFAVLVVIIAAHVLFLEIFHRNGRSHFRLSAADSTRGELFFFEIPPPEEESTPALPTPQPVARAQRKAPPAPDNAITLPEEESVPPDANVDFYGDAADVARDSLAKSQEPKPRAFGTQPQSPYHQRKKRKPGYEWRPEEKKAGFAGPIPYFRVGRRCIIVPPFFGCQLGKLPKPKGATLEEIRDPDRPRSSVPDPEP